MENEATADLAAVAQARAALADRLITPWWYHPALGLLLAGYVLGVSLGTTTTVRLATSALLLASSVVLMRTYRRLTGVWVSGFDADGNARRYAIALGAIIGTTTFGGWAAAYWADQAWPAYCLAALACAAGVVLGRRFDTALREQLRADA